MRIALAASALLALLSVAPRASALDWIDPPRDRVFAGSPDGAARAFLHEQPSLVGVELTTRASLPSVVGTTVRLDQRWHGLPVLGASAAVRVSAGGHVTAATSTLAGRIGLSTATPSMNSADAIALVASLTRRPTSAVRNPVLGVQVSGDAPEGRLVWQVDVASRPGGERLVIDATSGRVRGRRALSREVKGKVYPVDFVATPEAQTVDLLDLDPMNVMQLRGYQGQLSVYQYTAGDYTSADYQGSPVIASNGNDFLYDPPTTLTNTTDPFAAVNSYYHTHRIRSFYTSVLGVDMSAPSWQLGVIANALDGGAPLDNAFYSPMGMTSPPAPNLIAIGQGTDVDFAYDSDIFIHEFTHYVAYNAIDYNDGQFELDSYGVSAFGGSIDEGTADYFACTVNGDPLLGEATLAEYTRDLAAPSARCPEGLTGEVHEDGKIIATASWSIRQLLGPDIADPLIWSGMTLLHKGSSLQDFATSVLKTADDMVAIGKVTASQRAQIAAIFAERGLDDCGRVLSLNMDSRTVNMFGLGTIAPYLGNYSCYDLQGQVSLQSSFHFSFRPAYGPNQIRFFATVTDLEGFGDELRWSIYARRGKPVEFTSSDGYFPEVSAFDLHSETFTGNSGQIIIGEGSSLPLEPNETYYAVVVHENCPYTQLTMSVGSYFEPPVGGAGGVSGSAGSGGGTSAGSGGVSGTSGHSGQTTGGHAGQATGGTAGLPARGQPELEAVPSATSDGACTTSSTGASTSGGASAAWLLGLAAVVRRRRR